MTDDHMIDNAATASQNLTLLDDPVTRESIKLNIIEPLRRSLTNPTPVSSLGTSDKAVKAAAYEYLSHKGERPDRVLRGGQELWETHAAAIKAAIVAAAAKDSPVSISSGIPQAARDYLEATERLLDWMNGNDLSADHAAQKPGDFKRLGETLVHLRAALAATTEGSTDA